MNGDKMGLQYPDGCFICNSPDIELEITRYGKWYKLCGKCGKCAPDSYVPPKRRTIGEIGKSMSKLKNR